MKRASIENIIGGTITEFRSLAFYLNKNCVCEIITLSIEFDNQKWVEFFSSEGENVIRFPNVPHEVLKLDDIANEFAYPVSKLNLPYLGKKVINIQQYLWKGKEDLGLGFYFELNDNSSFSLIELEDECEHIYDGLFIRDGYCLSPL